MRTLIIILAVIMAAVIIKRLITTRSRSKKVVQSNTLEDYKDTVRCKHCGTHVPISSALKKDGHFYCNENHYLLEKNKT